MPESIAELRETLDFVLCFELPIFLGARVHAYKE